MAELTASCHDVYRYLFPALGMIIVGTHVGTINEKAMAWVLIALKC